MSTEFINGFGYLNMLRSGASRLKANITAINDLNVFPIPDGDTGDNMYMTISSGCSKPHADTISDTASSVSSGMLMGARGNSGVILSRIFAGIAKGLAGLAEAGVPEFKKALQCGVEDAYSAVSNPTEGTILTVLRESVALAAGNEAADFETYLESVVEKMEKSLENTPELLPVLKEAGVVDSGGAGLLCIFRGMLDGLSAEAEDDSSMSSGRTQESSCNLDDFGPDSVLEFGYCTEFLLRLQTSKISDLESFDETEIKDYLNSVGESVVCFREGSVVKVHVHTMTPGDILSHVQKWGEFLTVKIENMTLQHSGVEIKDEFSPKVDFSSRKKRYGIVAVASGDGLVNTFREAGVDEVINGGQTMNPSTEDFINAFDRICAEIVFVFPNNSNIIMAAKQAASMYSKSEIIVIPSKSIGAGYVAAASIDRDCKNKGEIEQAALATIGEVTTCNVSRAVRDAVIDGMQVIKDDYIAYVGGNVLSSASTRNRAVLDALEQAGVKSHDVALVFYGCDTPESEASELSSELGKLYPRTEFILTDGGQPVNDYIIVLC